jgi:hypothetical protein
MPSRQWRWQQAHRLEGLCITCSQKAAVRPDDPNRRYRFCQKHLEQERKRKQNVNANKKAVSQAERQEA